MIDSREAITKQCRDEVYAKLRTSVRDAQAKFSAGAIDHAVVDARMVGEEFCDVVEDIMASHPTVQFRVRIVEGKLAKARSGR